MQKRFTAQLQSGNTWCHVPKYPWRISVLMQDRLFWRWSHVQWYCAITFTRAIQFVRLKWTNFDSMPKGRRCKTFLYFVFFLYRSFKVENYFLFPQLPITVSRELTPATQTPHATPFQAPRSSASAKRKEASTAMGHTVSVSFVYLGDVLIDDGSVVLRNTYAVLVTGVTW